MATAATRGQGTLLKIGAGGTDILEVLDISGPAVAGRSVEVTSHDSTSGWVERIVTLLDGGQVTFRINYVPTTTTHKYAAGGLLYLLGQRTLQAFDLVFVLGTTTWQFSGFVTNFTPNAPIADQLTADVTIDISGVTTLV
jgi:hypothetical protein